MTYGLLYHQFRDVGQDLYQAGLVSSHGGNLSVRVGDKMVIKRRGTMLGRLRPQDLVEIGLLGNGRIPLASSELIVHRAIYLATSAQAIVHAHPRTAVALSLTRDVVVPLDVEGGILLGQVPVAAVEIASGSPELANAVAGALTAHPVVVVRGHGSFAIGETLEQAFQRTSVLEEACEIVWKVEMLAK